MLAIMLETAPATHPESILWDDWHVVAQVEMLTHVGRSRTALFGRELEVTSREGGFTVSYTDDDTALPVAVKYGLIWTCLGEPSRPLIDFPESAEPDRYVIAVGSLGIRVSGLRLVENFLDLAHFPYVHTGYLGSEAATEVFPYNVRVTDSDELWVTDCVFEQPKSSAVSDAAIDVKYMFRVMRPYTVVLEKTNAVQKDRTDTIGLVVQPVSEEQCIAHGFTLSLMDGDPDESCKWFQRLITSQDKGILENQVPRRLPLDPRAELPVRADIGGTAYRRWLAEHGVRYGAIPVTP
jgi:phenylpropionate dioxygenase-like ring-hydroxylating dioxygenase large terminal subunit